MIFVERSASFSAQPILRTHPNTYSIPPEMNQRIAAINDKIDSILAALHWDRQDLKNWYIQVGCRCQVSEEVYSFAHVEQEQRECVSCPFDRRHLVPRDGQESHLRKCMEKHQKDGGARRKVSVVTCVARVCVCVCVSIPYG